MNSLGRDPVTTAALIVAFLCGAIPARYLGDSWRRRSEGWIAWLYVVFDVLAIVASATAGVLAVRKILL